MKKIISIASILLVVGLIGVVIAFATGNVSNYQNSQMETLDEKKTFAVDSIDSIDVDASIAHINLKSTDDDEITVHAHGSIDKDLQARLEMTEVSNNLEVKWKIKNSDKDLFDFIKNPTLQFEEHVPVIDLYLPEKEWEKVSVNVDVGKLVAKGFTTDDFNATVDVGEIQINEVEGPIKGHSDTGKISLKLTQVNQNIDLSTDVGEIDLRVEKPIKDTRIEARTDVGDVKSDLIGFDFSEETERMINASVGEALHKVKLTSDVGSIRIENK